MALIGCLPRSLRLRSLILETRRLSGSLCQMCHCKTSDIIDTKKSSMELHVENEDITETKLVSVMNLMSLFENLPPGEKGETFVDRIRRARKSFEKQGYDDLSHRFCKSDHRFVDGDTLDTLFGISTQSDESRLSCVDLKSAVSQTEETPNFIFLTRDTPVYSFLEEDSLRHSFSNYVDASWHSSDNILICDSGEGTQKGSQSSPPNDKRPNLDELNLIQDHFNEYLPRCFSQKHEYRIYSPAVVFENNFAEKPFITQGIGPYVREMSKYRVYGHFRYANVKMTVLKSTVHEDEGVVRIRWRISGIPQVRAFMFWKFLPWRYNKSMNTESEWMDGLSTFSVEGGSGVITKHRVDRVILDKNLAENVIKNPALSMSGTV